MQDNESSSIELLPKVWVVVSSCRNDTDIVRILEQIYSSGLHIVERVVVVDSEGTEVIPALIAKRGWNRVIYKSYEYNLGSGGNLSERLRIATEGGAMYAYALNHDGSFDSEVVMELLKAAVCADNLGAAYPLSYLTSTGRFNVTGMRELPLPALLVKARPSCKLIDVFWSSSNGALYSTAPAKQGILPWPAMWMGWEDLEYGWRLSDHGYRQVIVCDAVYHDNYEYRQTWLGDTIDKPAWRTYYFIRNLILAIRRTRRRLLFYVVAIYRALLEMILILLVRESKVNRLWKLCLGAWDGVRQDTA